MLVVFEEDEFRFCMKTHETSLLGLRLVTFLLHFFSKFIIRTLQLVHKFCSVIYSSLLFCGHYDYQMEDFFNIILASFFPSDKFFSGTVQKAVDRDGAKGVDGGCGPLKNFKFLQMYSLIFLFMYNLKVV